MSEAVKFHGEEFATELSRPYWTALHEGRFDLQRCQACFRYQHYPRIFCVSCGGDDLGWAPIGLAGTVLAAVLTHRTSKEYRKEALPYWIVIMRLEEGPTLLTTANGEMAPGDSVEIDLAATRETGLLTARSIAT